MDTADKVWACALELADNNCLKVPEALTDEQVVFLSDILATGWHANELARVGEGDNVPSGALDQVQNLLRNTLPF